MQPSIIKNFFLISSVQFFRILCTVIQNKVVAYFMGVNAAGVFAIFHSFISSTATFANASLAESGCRSVAKKQSQEELQRVLKTLLLLIVSLAIGFPAIGFFFSDKISAFLFKSPDYEGAIRICWVAIAIAAISKGLIAIVNGFQEIKKYAMIHVCGYLLSAIFFVAGIYCFMSVKIFPYLLLIVECCILLTCLFFFPYRELNLKMPFTLRDFTRTGKQILSLTAGFFSAVILSSLMPLCSQSFLNHHFGLETVGLYQAAWQVSGLYTGFLISSMGVDFIPRATKVIGDKEKLNELVNDQIKFGMMLSGIAIVGVISFSDLFLTILFSSKFVPATNIIRWQILGVSLRVISFPFTYSLIALGKSKVYLLIQSVFWIGEFLLLVLVSKLFGEKALGSNYLLGYSVYTALVICTGVHFFRFRPSKELKFLVGFNLFFMAIALLNVIFLSGILRIVFSCVILSVMCCVIWKQFDTILGCSPWAFLLSKLKK